MKCVIFGAASIEDYSFCRVTHEDFVICADGGLRHAEALGRKPDLVLGDFDSYGEEPHFPNLLTYPSEKDDTDMGIAVKYAVAHGMEEICIYGGLKGRMDHTLANLQLLAYPLKKGVPAYLQDEHTFVTLFQGEYVISEKRYRYLSLFPYGGRVTGITGEGLKYPLENGVFESADYYGVSNEMTGQKAKITAKSGTILLIMTDE